MEQTTTQVIDPTVSQEPPAESDFDNYGKAKLRIDRLIGDFKSEIDRTSCNREDRFKELNISELRNSGIIGESDFMIPVRVIDSNIRREQPSFINYLKQSRRLCIFKCITDSGLVTDQQEEEFTRGMTYSGWEIPHFKAVDGSQTHGWDSVEVVFDETKPFHVAIEHIGHDRLIFPLDAIDIQACELIIRHYSITPQQLNGFVKTFGFNPKEVKTLTDKNKETKKETSIDVYKCLWKRDGVVFYAWYGSKAADWLKAPTQLHLGISSMVEDFESGPIGVDPATGVPMFGQKEVDEPVTVYPVFILPYYETEQSRITDHHGRVYLDKHKQEALTANLSQFLNGCQKASSIYPTLKSESFLTAAKLQSIKIKENEIAPVALDFAKIPYPDAVMLNLQQYMDTYNSQEVGQVNFAVQNRKDSRKTATEISAAKEETSMLGSVQVSLYSTFIRQTYNLVWKIVQSQALSGKITFMFDPVMGANNIEVIGKEYDVRAAGDVDVIKRQELITQYKEFWPVIQNTPAAIPFLARMLQLSFVDDGAKFAKIIEQGDPRAVLLQLVQILEATLTPEEVTGIPPEQRMVLMQVLEQAKGISEQYLQEQIEKNPALAEKVHNQPQSTDGDEAQEGIKDNAPKKGGESYGS